MAWRLSWRNWRSERTGAEALETALVDKPGPVADVRLRRVAAGTGKMEPMGGRLFIFRRVGSELVRVRRLPKGGRR